MLTLTKTIQFEESEVAPIAYELGYEDKVIDPNFVSTPEKDRGDLIDNPESMIDFISKKADEVIAKLLAQASKKEMETTKKLEIQNTAKAIEDGIKERIVTTQS